MSARESDDPDETPLGVHDLRVVVALGRERLAGLLTSQEEAVCDRIMALSGPPAALFARLSARTRTAVAVDALDLADVPDAHAAVDALVAEGLLAEGARWDERLVLATVPVLKAWCAARDLPGSGRRADLVARLLPARPVPAAERIVRRPHVALVRRLERAALMDKRADRGRLVAERLGHVRFAEYTPTGGAVLYRDRAHLLAWEALFAEGEGVRPARAVLGLQAGHAEAPGRLSLRRRLTGVVVEHAHQLRRGGEPAEARAWLDALRIVGAGEHALARARCLEDDGEVGRAFEVLQAGLDTSDGADRLALHRTGRRLGRALHRAWIPDPPLRKAPRRSLALEPGDARHRPTWRVDGADRFVEDAVARVIAGAGRQVLRAEGGILRALFVHLFADALLAPVAGQLPVPRLPGPLDLGRPAFAARRPGLVFAALDAIARGEAEARIAAAVGALDGVRLAGVPISEDLGTTLILAARSLGPSGLRAVLGPILAHGLRATRGLPDLLVLAGDEVRLADAHPTRITAGALWVEVKGPGDTLSDEQRVWLDRLVRAGAAAEVWDVRGR